MMSNSNSSLDNTSDQDYTEFLNEYLLQNHSPHNEPDTNYEGMLTWGGGGREGTDELPEGLPGQLTGTWEDGLHEEPRDMVGGSAAVVRRRLRELEKKRWKNERRGYGGNDRKIKKKG